MFQLRHSKRILHEYGNSTIIGKLSVQKYPTKNIRDNTTDNDYSLFFFFYLLKSRELVLKTKPNNAHKALKAFENKILSQPNQRQTFVILTQNVDGLSSDIKNLIEIHGSLFRTRCVKCGDVKVNRESPIVPALAGTELSNMDANIPIEKLPRCLKCNEGLLRPDVIWFEEPLDREVVKTVEFELKRCDLLLVIGTSGTVYPAAGYASLVSFRGGKVAQFNIEEMGNVDFEL